MKDKDKIKHLTKISSLSLHALDESNIPIATASGCFVNYKGKQFLLTVSHAILKEGRWGIALEYDFEKNGLKYYCPKFQWVTLGKITLDHSNLEYPLEDLVKDSTTIDFAYAEIPSEIIAIDEYFDFENSLKYSCPKNVISTDLTDKPQIGVEYSFYGNVRSTINKDKHIILSTPQMALSVEYICDFKDLFYRFQLSGIIKDMNDYKGCSGAPIIDEEGKLVSLLTNGLEKSNVILGIKLDKLKIALDIEVNAFS